MKIRSLFDKYQKYLLAFVNTNFGKDYLGIKDKDYICKITPDSFHILKDKQVQATFYSRSPYLKKFRLALEGLETAGKLLSKIWKPEFVIPHFQGLNYASWLPLVMRSTLTVYPDADAETTTVDGYVARGSVDEAFSTIRAGAGSASGDSDASASTLLEASSTNNQFATLRRLIMLFDTSSLTSNCTINSAVLSVYGNDKDDSLDADTFDIVSSAPTSNTELANADYGNVGSTSYGNVAYASFDTSGYNDVTLNATGLATVSKTGISKFGARIGWDISGTFSGSWSDSALTYHTGIMADTGSNKPKLVVTYTPAGGAILRNFI